jgi:hypothetical protein
LSKAPDWLQISKDAYLSSTTFVDSNYRKQWENNIRMHQSKHPADSKYHSEAYKYRSKIFRPKTRAAGRKLEAAVASAFFSNMDVVNVDAANQKNPSAIEAAKVRKELMQYRLTKTIPWFVTLVGAAQDSYTVGVVCSYQYWEYKQKTIKRAAVDEMGQPMVGLDGEPVMQDQVKILVDKPCIELIPVENLRISPAAKWYDPIGTSPYLVEMIPMYVGDIREMMEVDDPKTGQPTWQHLDDTDIRASMNQAWDSTRQTREGKRQDSQQPTEALTDFEIAWVHRNIIRQKGEDWVYYTMGVEHLLSDPKPRDEVYFHKRRPYVMGVAQLETHKLYPQSPVEMGGEVQREINEVANQRLDNVKLVLNKRYVGKRGAQIDLKSLVNNVPGSVTLANDPEKDIREIEFNDVTSSSYEEHDRLNIEYDELIGNFSQGSVMNNRKLNETVGGMSMMNQGASMMTEYTIRTLVETWIEPVLNQLDALESAYETDQNILALVGDKAKVHQVTEDMLTEEVTFTVSVGMGATDPTQRVQRLLVACQTLVQMLANPVPGLNIQEIAKEVFGAVGYRDGGRFLTDQGDPRAMIAQLQEMIEQLKLELQKAQEKLADKQMKDQIAVVQAQQKIQNDHAKAGQDMQQSQQEFAMNLQQERQQWVTELAQIQARSAEEMRQMQVEFAQKMRDMEEKAALERQIMKQEAQAQIEIDRKECAAQIASDKEKANSEIAQSKQKADAQIAQDKEKAQAKAKEKTEPAGKKSFTLIEPDGTKIKVEQD